MEEFRQVVIDGKVFLTEREVRRRTRLSVQCMYELRQHECFPPSVRHGRLGLVPEIDLDRWFATLISLRDQLDALPRTVIMPRWVPDLGPPIGFPMQMRALRVSRAERNQTKGRSKTLPPRPWG